MFLFLNNLNDLDRKEPINDIEKFEMNHELPKLPGEEQQELPNIENRKESKNKTNKNNVSKEETNEIVESN